MAGEDLGDLGGQSVPGISAMAVSLCLQHPLKPKPLGFRELGFRGAGFRGLGFRVLEFKLWSPKPLNPKPLNPKLQNSSVPYSRAKSSRRFHAGFLWGLAQQGFMGFFGVNHRCVHIHTHTHRGLQGLMSFV